MPVPNYQSFMLPMLQALSGGIERSMPELYGLMADHFKLSETERQEPLPSGGKSLLANRVSWAKTYLKKAGLVDQPSRGKVRLTPLGQGVLTKHPSVVDTVFLKQFDSFAEFVGKDVPVDVLAPLTSMSTSFTESTQTPQELIESSFQTLRKAAAEELLERLKKCSPGFFEIVVVRLLQALGYGATGEALVTGKSGDAGIDGFIKEDKLGLDVVCVQAKRWEATVGRPVIQGFVGSMDYVRAKKGVVITTSTFTKDAIDSLHRIEGKKVVLIDGKMLAGLMIDYGVGVVSTKHYEIKEVSNDFFDEDEG